MINKNILPVATVLVLSSGINSFANGNETNIEYRNFINNMEADLCRTPRRLLWRIP